MFVFIASLHSQTFTNVASEAGVDIWGDYVAIGDVNGDGYQDIFIALDNWSGVAYDYLFINNRNGTFTDKYDSSGLRRHYFFGHHPTFGDFDNDGDQDLFIANDTLYINNGDGTFYPKRILYGMTFPQDYLRGSFILDINNDGKLDVITNYLPRQGSRRELILLNRGNNDFEVKYFDYFGIQVLDLRSFWTDINNDIKPDIILNSYGLFLNNGNLTFSYLMYLPRGEFSFGDINNDGFLDICVTNESGLIKLLLNNGDSTFTDITNSAGLNVTVSYGGPLMADFNNDGYIDIYISQNGRNDYLFINNKNNTFTNIVPDSCYMNGGSYKGYLDYDRDGDIDLYVINSSDFGYNDFKCFLYRNNLSDSYDGTNNWIIITLEGVKSNRDAVGARVECYSYSENSLLKQVRYVGLTYVSQSMLPVHFGLGSSQTIDSIIIRWPSGIIQKLTNLPINQYITIIEDTTLTTIDDYISKVDFNLYQNFPNPFNSKTKIRFSISNFVFMSLKVFDLLGREVATLIDEPKEAGIYEIEFDASKYNLSSGVYIYQMKSGSFIQSKKLILMK